MKKSLLAIILPLALVTLSSCVKYNGRNKDGSPKGETTSGAVDPSGTTSVDPSSPDDPGSQTTVHLYLTLGPNGLYDGNPGAAIPAKFLENTVEGDFVVGNALPGTDHVTSTITNAKFSYWVNRDTTEIVTSVPATEAVLVAVYVNGDGDAIPANRSGFGFLFSPRKIDNRVVERTYIGEESGTDPQGRPQYHVEDISFFKDEHFVLYDFGHEAGWVEPIEETSLGGHWQDYLEIVDGYFNVKQDFSAIDIYIKVALGNNSIYMALKS